MRKEVLFLADTYCSNLESLKTLLEQQCYDESFRAELLTYYADGVLTRWLKERNVDFVMELVETHSDIALFKSIYQSILGSPCLANLSCDFFKYAELISFNDGETSRQIKIGDSQQIVKGGNRLSFVFKQKKAGNEVFRLSLKIDDRIVETQELLFDTGSNEQEKVITFHVKSPTNMIYLVEGSNNVLCSLAFYENMQLTSVSPFRNKTISLKLYAINSDFYMTEIISDASQVSKIIDVDNMPMITYGIGYEGSRQLLDSLNEIYQGWKFKFPTVEQLQTVLDLPTFSKYKGRYRFHLGNGNTYPNNILVDFAVAFVAEIR